MTTASYKRNEAAKNRRRVLEHYGTTCACCGSAENLTVDHIDGSGKSHRDEIGKSSAVMSAWLIRNNFPPGFQILCRPCNNNKRNRDRCHLNHDACPTCHRPFDETVPALDHRGNRIWA